MKAFIAILIVGVVAFIAWDQVGGKLSEIPEKAKQREQVATPEVASTINRAMSVAPLQAEIACAKHHYHKEGAPCQAAVRLLNRTMLVEGVSVDPVSNGLCSGAKSAVVEGEMQRGAFVAKSVRIKP
ncbi:MAG: hypothetical protein HKN21_13775 [Candidatus Eisenbacteria bacterium]|uniref:Uncharacterized protein n=1 Tax=Eiseniibacteriota bacterium TaxID=2212470 RepID=A0A7Y2EB54_UNCEI|nr:hypothetical protein [Candidatus Eisenbacteria bacterium]